MRRAVYSPYKPGFPIWPQGFDGLYPPGLISAVFFNEGGANAAANSAYLTDSLQNEVFIVENAGDMNTAAWIQGNGGPALNFPSGNFLGGTNYTRALDPQTFVLWMKPGTNGCPIAKNDANSVNAGWALATTSTLMEFLLEFSSTNMIRSFTTPANWLTAWHHVAIVTDNSTTAANSVCYIDGVLAAVNSSQNGSGSHGSDSGDKYLIGRTIGSFSGFASGNWAGGSLESVLLFNRQLSVSEIQALFAQSYRYYHRIVTAPSVSQQFTQTLSASMSTFSGALTRQTDKSLSAGMHTFDAVLSTNNVIGKVINAAMATFDATLNKFTSKTISASMSTFSGAIGKLIIVARATFNAAMSTFAATLTPLKLKTAVFNASMLQFAGRITKQINKALTAGMSTWSVSFTAQFIKAANLKTLTASMATFAGALTFSSTKTINASMALFSATLSLVVTHGGVPPTCIPAACDTIATIISHVEQCELEGS